MTDNLPLDFDAQDDPQGGRAPRPRPTRDHRPHAERALAAALRAHGSAWIDQATALVLACGLRCAGHTFLTEEVAAFAHGHGLPLPPNGRAWGGVVTRLRRASQIYSQGHALAHDGSPKTLWRLAFTVAGREPPAQPAGAQP